ncbi:MAG: shikimate kinase [Clostridia bacterium]|nr:shikimate kinase [Clostridia bacterium]
MKNNIILIGMPGCGKSTIGVLLAKNLAFRFLDSDLVIQERDGRRLQEIIDDLGPEKFSAYEDSVNASLDPHNTVVATGGSAVYGKNAMEHFNDIGTVVYLRTSFEEITRRIKDFNTRGLVIPEGKTFEDVYRERVPLYERYADITVDTDEKDLWDVVEEITEQL